MNYIRYCLDRIIEILGSFEDKLNNRADYYEDSEFTETIKTRTVDCFITSFLLVAIIFNPLLLIIAPLLLAVFISFEFSYMGKTDEE